MANYTVAVIGSVLLVLVVFILLSRMMKQIPADRLGFVFILGAYKMTLRPGFYIVSPLAMVKFIVPGSGTNGMLGLRGVAKGPLDPELPAGLIDVGGRSISARSSRLVEAGAPVRVVEDATPGVVLVVREPGPLAETPLR
jgi:membrane-bound ClpP family serine protease